MTMPKMPSWAKKRGLSQSEYNRYLTWMKSRYGWRSDLLGRDSYYYDFIYTPATIGPATIGPATTPTGRQFPWSKTVTPTPTPTPTLAPAPEAEPQDMIWFAPNVALDRSTNTFYDLESSLVLPAEEAMERKNQYGWEQYKSQQGVDWGRQAAIQTQQFMAYLNQIPQSNLGSQLAGRKQMATDYETWRERLLAELITPSDWITRWQVMNQSNPYTVSAEEEQRAIAEERIEQLQWEIGSLQSEHPNPLLTGTVEEKLLELETIEREQEGIRAYGEQLEVIAGRNAQLNRPSTPPAPSWLPQFVPGLAAGQPITKQRTVIPSGQQWAKTPWSQREGLAGYTEWAGYTPYQDMLEQMAMMQPSTPNIAYRWRPEKQRR